MFLLKLSKFKRVKNFKKKLGYFHQSCSFRQKKKKDCFVLLDHVYSLSFLQFDFLVFLFFCFKKRVFDGLKFVSFDLFHLLNSWFRGLYCVNLAIWLGFCNSEKQFFRRVFLCQGKGPVNVNGMMGPETSLVPLTTRIASRSLKKKTFCLKCINNCFLSFFLILLQ